MRKIKLFGILALVFTSSIAFAQKTRNVKLFVSPYTTQCTDQTGKQCLQVKFSNDGVWQTLSSKGIEGFDYQKGYDYKLKVVQTANPELADSYSYKLKKVVSQKAIQVKNYYDKKLILSKLNGKDVSLGGAYATINLETQTIFGNSGCNRFNVSYTTDKKGNISVYSGIGTLMACEQSKMNLEFEFLAAFQNQKFKITENGNTVIFTNLANNNVIEFSIPTQESIWSYINGKDWKLIQLDNVGKDYKGAFVVFNVADKKINGSTGCNKFFGSFSTNGDEIAFSQVGLTRMMCLEADVMETENKILGYLNAPNLRFDVADQTLNIYKGDKLVMIFAK